MPLLASLTMTRGDVRAAGTYFSQDRTQVSEKISNLLWRDVWEVQWIVERREFLHLFVDRFGFLMLTT